MTNDVPEGPGGRWRTEGREMPTIKNGHQMQLQPPANGAGRLQGGNSGNGGAVPPSVVRARSRSGFYRLLPKLEQIARADGYKCENCGYKKGRLARDVDVIRAIDTLGRYGLFASRLDLEEVKTRLAKTVAKAEEVLPPDLAEVFLRAIDPIWNPGKH